MSLFPHCGFEVRLAGGGLVPGKRADGELVLDVPEDIPRAEKVLLAFRSTAWAGYGAGKSRSVVRRVMFVQHVHAALPREVPLPRGVHRYPFAFDVPAWLPPAYAGDDCGIAHAVEARLDVEWAFDPVAKLVPRVAPAPREGFRAPVTIRSPPRFHEQIVLEVTLASAVVRCDEPISGAIALRSGHGARFDALVLSIAGAAWIAMGRGDRRSESGTAVRIPATALRSGEPVPFMFPPDARLLPTFRSAFIDHEVALNVKVDVPWSLSDPSFEVALEVLPYGSTIVDYGTDAARGPVGGERLRRLAASMAQATGFAVDRAPSFVHGAVGPVAVRVLDAPRGGVLGVTCALAFPDVELGLLLRPRGVLDAFRGEPLLPPALRERYHLHREREDDGATLPPTPDDAVAAFVAAALADCTGADDVRLSDHHLEAHFVTPDDEERRMIEVARFAQRKAAALADAIARLPWRAAVSETAREAWRGAAAEQRAVVVPTGPSLHGVWLQTRVLGGELRAASVSVRTRWTNDGAMTRVELDLTQAPLPAAAVAALEGDSPAPFRAAFASATASPDGRHATLEQSGLASDPRELLPAVEAFFQWVLDARGERRADAPYR